MVNPFGGVKADPSTTSSPAFWLASPTWWPVGKDNEGAAKQGQQSGLTAADGTVRGPARGFRDLLDTLWAAGVVTVVGDGLNNLKAAGASDAKVKEQVNQQSPDAPVLTAIGLSLCSRKPLLTCEACLLGRQRVGPLWLQRCQSRCLCSALPRRIPVARRSLRHLASRNHNQRPEILFSLPNRSHNRRVAWALRPIGCLQQGAKRAHRLQVLGLEVLVRTL
mmetsp:Transcript_73858/g.196608  ORF Transcript_73858/g.196608 Transcript_73858/m.196608 type:complete len:221 (+) Transcript_73858:386-1048(+)